MSKINQKTIEIANRTKVVTTRKVSNQTTKIMKFLANKDYRFCIKFMSKLRGVQMRKSTMFEDNSVLFFELGYVIADFYSYGENTVKSLIRYQTAENTYEFVEIFNN